jgi:hypothetical protein
MKKGGGPMTCRNNKLFSILFFALGVFFSNAAQAQCTPTLYLFRHAEDVDTKQPPPNQGAVLTAVGAQHAALYQPMITQLEMDLGAQSPCRVQRVFATWTRPNPPTGVPAGTTNPYQTALPLAESLTNPPPPPRVSPSLPPARQIHT